MGSGQSSIGGGPDHSVTATPALSLGVVPSDGDTIESKTKPKKKKNKKSVDYQCRKQKRAWSKCVSSHYEQKFLPGKALEPEEDCDDLFETFRTCYLTGMLQQRQAKGLAPPKKDSMLHEFMVEEGMVEDE